MLVQVACVTNAIVQVVCSAYRGTNIGIGSTDTHYYCSSTYLPATRILLVRFPLAHMQGAKTGWIISTPTCLGEAELSTGHHFRYRLQERER